ncbi:uncharacterized protein ACJ7VT_005232 [Polymixia lowei]
MVNMKTFSTYVSGKTLGAHEAFVEGLVSRGATKVDSPEKSDITIVFCPVASRIENDINSALSKISGCKPVILVVMHYTFDKDRVVKDSSSLVTSSDVILCVDCLFHESDGLLNCSRNEDAFNKVAEQMGLSKGDSRKLPPTTSTHTAKSQSGMVNMKTFSTYVSGKTLGADKAFVEGLVSRGATKVDSPEKSDITIVFCPIASRMGTDIDSALSKISGCKPVILVVMHHTFDKDRVVEDSSSLVTSSDVILRVDCLLHETDGLLNCSRNEDAFNKVAEQMGLSKGWFPRSCVLS